MDYFFLTNITYLDLVSISNGKNLFMTISVHHTHTVFFCSVGYTFWWWLVGAETCKDFILNCCTWWTLLSIDAQSSSMQ
jgi:hypothetical protein